MYGEIIRKIRSSLNMTTRQFEKLTGISHSYISMLEKEKSYHGKEKLEPTISTLKQICDAAGYPFRTFLEEAGYLEPLSPLQNRCGELASEKQTQLLIQLEAILNERKDTNGEG